MPKAAKATGKARAQRLSATKREDNGTRGDIDTSRWRKSKIWHKTTITKSNAMKQYRLGQEAFKDLQFERQPTAVPGIGAAEMHLYLERDVEHRAWVRHGGPENFDAFLEKLYQRHLKSKHADRPFTQPSQYSFGHKIVPMRERWDHAVTASFTLSSIKRGMDPWLWEACTSVFWQVVDGYEFTLLLYRTAREQERPFLLAEEFARTYPRRPSQSLPSSQSVDSVRRILADAATTPKEDAPDWGCRLEGLKFHRNCWPEEEEWYDWSPEYLEKLYNALICVIEEHGLGDEGWRSIRWEVYDKALIRSFATQEWLADLIAQYAETMDKHISYKEQQEKWEDDAAHWLDGRFTTEGILLDFTGRRCCPAGERDNAMLPLLDAKGRQHVGCVR